MGRYLPRLPARNTVISTRLEGWDEQFARLENFPDRMRNNFLKGGARAAASLLAKRLKARIQGDGLATLAGSVRQSVRTFDGGMRVRGVVQYGGRYRKASGRGKNRKVDIKDPWYAHIFEWGARPHPIYPAGSRSSSTRDAAGFVHTKISNRAALYFGGRFASRVPKHPGIRARLYATHTAQQDMPAAQKAFEDYIDKRVEQYWRSK